MPNHVVNVIRPTHETDFDIADKIAEAVKSEEREFDFDKIVSMPADVFRATSARPKKPSFPAKKIGTVGVRNTGARSGTHTKCRDITARSSFRRRGRIRSRS